MRYEDLLEEAANMGVAVEERFLIAGKCGYYYDAVRLIVIDENMPGYMRCCTLVHELAHARYRDHDCRDAKAERRARRETALRLVDPAEYAVAERIFGGDSYLIACELNVTVQVIEDYKQLLHDSVA